MFPITCLSRSFEGEPLPFFTYQGQLATPLKALGRRLGYARNGERLVQHVTHEWAAEFEEGKHWVRLRGEQLADFKAASALATDSVARQSPNLILLLEAGIHLVLLKTCRPIGVRLRDFLATEVMPQLLRSGQYTGAPAPTLEPRPVPTVNVLVRLPAPPSPTHILAAGRARRLAGEHALRVRKFESQDLRQLARTLHQAGRIDQTMWLAYEVAATEVAIGRSLPDLRPVVDERWYTREQMAELAGVRLRTMRVAIDGLGLRGAPGVSRKVLSKAQGADRMIHTWVYNDVAFGRVLALFEGVIPAKGA